MRLRVDRKADALYFRLSETPIVESEEVSPGVVLDYDADNKVVGVEVLKISQRAGDIDLDKLLFETSSGAAGG